MVSAIHEQSSPLLYTEATPHKDGRLYSIGEWQNIPEIIHDEKQVRGFFGPYRPLSNFWHARILLDGQEYGSVERAYQAAKWHPEDRAFFATCTNAQSVKYNRQHTPNKYSAEEWDAIKIDVMRFLLEQKFDEWQNPESAEFLFETGARNLVETNWWGDRFWGEGLDGVGENHLGKLLMTIRAENSERMAERALALGL